MLLATGPASPAFQIEAGDVVTLAIEEDPTILAEFVVLDTLDCGEEIAVLIVPAADFTSEDVTPVMHSLDHDEMVSHR